MIQKQYRNHLEYVKTKAIIFEVQQEKIKKFK